MNNNLNSQSSQEQKKNTSDSVFENIIDYFFDKIVFINLAYSDFGSGGTTSTSFDKDSRIIDTAAGMLMKPGRESRIRCQFYLKNPSKLHGYLLSPAVLDSYSTSSLTTSLSTMRSYAGLKFDSGIVYVAVKEAGKPEVLYRTNFILTMYDATYTDTYAIEMRHNIGYTDIYINNSLLGSYSSDMVGSYTEDYTFYPFFAPGRSTDGSTSVNIVAENIQFIQNK